MKTDSGFWVFRFKETGTENTKKLVSGFDKIQLV